MNIVQTGNAFPEDGESAYIPEFIRQILENLPLDNVITDMSGNTIFVPGHFWKNWTGKEHPPGTPISQLTDNPDDQARISDAIASAGPDVAQIELAITATGGELHHALLAVSDCSNIPDFPRGSVCIQFTDITALKQRENELRQLETRWNNALVNSASGVWDIHLPDRQMYYSDTWRAIRGIPPGEEIRDNYEGWLAKLHPDDREHVLHCIPRQNNGDPDYAVFEYRELHRDGHWVWIECRGACVERDENGNPTRIVGIDTDITARKNAEQAMVKLSRRLRLAMEASQIGVFETDFDAGKSEWDDRMYSIFGVEGTPEVVINGLWETRVHPEDRRRVEENVTLHVNGLIPFSDEYRIRLPDGSERYIFSRTLPFIDSDGHRKMIGANWDMTRERSLQRELEKAKTLAEARNRELEDARVSIEYNAMHDYLTDLPNRRYLDTRLESMSQECRQDGCGIGILHIDLDRFKQINDTLGHRAGDAMLRHAAQSLRANIREDDFVARIGGDEFVVVSRYNGTSHRLSGLAERIIRELKKPVNYEGHICRYGASIGIAASNPGDDVDPATILLNADIALYKAKNLGRNRYEFFSECAQDLMISTRRTADEILSGLERSEFVPWYQFQFDARTLDITGVETLARWKHPSEGILGPHRFLDVAEELAVVSSIDSMILEKALVDFRQWEDAGLHIPRISVNVSSRRLQDPDLPRMLKALSIAPGKLSFELLETTFLDRYEDDVKHNLDFLRQSGIDVEIDDFGTGYASIISLLRINPSALKIDRELINPVPDSAEQRKLVGSIIEIGKTLDLKVVAEGVETAAHIDVLRDLGCDTLQGFALARPMPAGKVADFVTSRAWMRNATAK